MAAVQMISTTHLQTRECSLELLLVAKGGEELRVGLLNRGLPSLLLRGRHVRRGVDPGGPEGRDVRGRGAASHMPPVRRKYIKVPQRRLELFRSLGRASVVSIRSDVAYRGLSKEARERREWR